MPHMPNWKEFAGATQQAQKDVIDVYDATYGTYKVMPEALAAGTPPPGAPSPFKLGNK